MGCHVHVSLPPLPGSDLREICGEDVQYTRAHARLLQSFGVPRVDEDGFFSHRGDALQFDVTALALDLEVQRLSRLLDEGDYDETTYPTWSFLRRWHGLYDTVIKLRARGLAADLFGA